MRNGESVMVNGEPAMLNARSVVDWDAVRPTRFEDWAQGKHALVSKRHGYESRLQAQSEYESRLQAQADMGMGVNDMKCQNFAESAMTLSTRLRQDKTTLSLSLGNSVFARRGGGFQGTAGTTTPLSSSMDNEKYRGDSIPVNQDLDDMYIRVSETAPQSIRGGLRSPAMGSVRHSRSDDGNTRDTPTQTSRTLPLNQDEAQSEVEQLREEIARLKQELKAKREGSQLDLNEYDSHCSLVPRGEQYALSQIAQQVGELRHTLNARKHGQAVGASCRSHQGDPTAFAESRQDFNSPVNASRLAQLTHQVREESLSRLSFEDSVRALESGEYLQSVMEVNE